MKFQDHIGLDIGERNIKLIQLARNGDSFSLSSIGITDSTPLSDAPGSDALISQSIKKLASDTGTHGKAVVLALPESQVYTRVIEMPYLEEPELSSTIKWQAEQYIPVSLADVVLKHQVLSLPETGVPNATMTVLLVAAPTSLITRYTSIISKAGLEAVAVETEIFAAARSLVANDDFGGSTLLVNFGSDTTTLAALKKGSLTLTQSIPTGGSTMVRALSSSLSLDMKQAEEYKKTYGLDSQKLDGKVYTTIKPIVDQIISEIKKVVAFSETRGNDNAIKRVILCGGNALTPGLLSYFTANLGLEVQLGNPFNRVQLTDKQRAVVFDAGPIFAASVGLAMKLT